jgi:purine-cytosine permease-like protein
MAPWLGIYLADIWLRRNTYEPAALHTRGGGRYWYQGGWNWPALVAFAAGIIAAALFANAPIYVGPLVPLVGGGDISILAGFLIAGFLYVILARRSATPVDLASQTNGV